VDRTALIRNQTFTKKLGIDGNVANEITRQEHIIIFRGGGGGSRNFGKEIPVQQKMLKIISTREGMRKDETGLRAGSPLSHTRQRRRAKQSGGKESGEETPTPLTTTPGLQK